ncbi:MAG: 5'-methylthioadenosine/S-adenosylhomocysteine nucleosidase [Bacillus subtilis]|nr:5'-methylthioadenosine/S-adenosylhomocysteine nucleosidase [Bacillus subtilis]
MIGIIAAMDKEIAGWLDLVAVREIVRIADKTFYLSSYEGDELVIAQSGIGKVNAAITAALLFSRFPIDFVVNTGVAGGVLPVKTGDLVVGDRILYSDVDLTKIDPIPYGQMAGEALYAIADPVLLGRAVAGSRASRVFLPRRRDRLGRPLHDRQKRTRARPCAHARHHRLRHGVDGRRRDRRQVRKTVRRDPRRLRRDRRPAPGRRLPRRRFRHLPEDRRLRRVLPPQLNGDDPARERTSSL